MMSSWPVHRSSCGMPCLLAVQVTWNVLSDMPKSQGLMGSLTVWVGEGPLQQSVMRGYIQVMMCEPSSLTCRPVTCFSWEALQEEAGQVLSPG